MEIRRGKSVFAGAAIGPILVYQRQQQRIDLWAGGSVREELARYEDAREAAFAQLETLRHKAQGENRKTEEEILRAHQTLLRDPDFEERVRIRIERERFSAQYAVWEAGQEFARTFSEMENETLRARSADVKDVTDRVIGILTGAQTSLRDLNEPVILLAEDLTPSETIQLDREKILALVTQKGSVNSHMAILARGMSIPCIVNADIVPDPQLNGRTGIADGLSGTLYIDPDEKTAADLQKKKEELERRRTLLLGMKGLPTVTKSGRRIRLHSNISGPADVDAVLQNDSEGIGLFRSEFLYLGRREYPSEEEQFGVYREVLSRMEGRQVIIRTLDIGADKQEGYLGIPEEDNPAMGLRGIRFCLNRPDVFRTQLRAIYRAARYGRAGIMFPMIISVEEVRRIRQIIAGVQEELREEKIPFGDVELGIMVETPAAVMIADLLAREVDFFSIGTNDLAQYALVIDRQNQSLADLYDPHHEAVLRMIEHTCRCAHENGAWCGICGELAADTDLTERFLSMGIDELSVSPALTLGLRKKIRELEV